MDKKNESLFYCLITGMLLIGALAYSSCSYSQTIIFETDGSGQSEVEYELADYFVNEIKTMAKGFGVKDQEKIFDPESIKTELAKNKNIGNVAVSSNSSGNMKINFDFDRIDAAFSEAAQESHGLFVWKDGGSTKTLEININRKNYEAFAALYPKIRDNPFIAGYGPDGTVGLERRDYSDLIEFSFGDSGMKARNALPNTLMNITIKVPGRIISQSGGRAVDSKTVLYVIPLFDVVMLDKELIYSVTFN